MGDGRGPCLLDRVVPSVPKVVVSFLDVRIPCLLDDEVVASVRVRNVDICCLLDGRDPSFEGADLDFERVDPLVSGFLPLLECDDPSFDFGLPRIARGL